MQDAIENISPITGWWFVAIFLALLGAAGLGYWSYRLFGRQDDDSRRFHSAEVLTVVGVLFSFFVGFSFSAAYDHFKQRRQLVLDEADALSTTYLRSQYLPQPQRRDIQSQLRQYLEVRLEMAKVGKIGEAAEESKRLTERIWQEATELERYRENPVFAALFLLSLNDLIDLQRQRVTVILRSRLPPTIFAVVGFLALLTLFLMGYTSAKSSSEDWVAFVVVVACASLVMVLVVDLDRPYERTFKISQSALQSVKEEMQRH